MSVRPPTSQRKTGQFSSKAEKIKALKERSRKLNPLSPTRKKIMQQIKKLEAASKPVPKKFTDTGKKIGDKKTKTGQFNEKTPKFKTPLFKLKDDPSKRLREKRLAEEKANREKVRLAKGRKASEKLLDIPPIKKVDRGKPGRTIGKQVGKSRTAVKGKVDPLAVKDKSMTKKKISPVDKSPKTYGGKFTTKTKPKIVAAKKKPKNRLEILKDRSKTTSIQKTDYINPRDPKRLEKIQKRKLGRTAVSDMLKARQAKPSDTDIASGRKAEAKRKADKLKRQAASTVTPPGAKRSIRRGRSPGALGGTLKTKCVSKKVAPSKLAEVPIKPPEPFKVKPTAKKKAPAKLVTTPGRKPTPPVSKLGKAPGALGGRKMGKAPGALGGKIKQPISMGKAMSDRPEGRRKRHVAEDKVAFGISKGGTKEDPSKGFRFNLFGKNKTKAEADKAMSESYAAEQEDRKKVSQQDFYQSGEGRRSQLKKGGMVKRNKGGAVRGVGQALRGFGNNSRYSNKMY